MPVFPSRAVDVIDLTGLFWDRLKIIKGKWKWKVHHQCNSWCLSSKEDAQTIEGYYKMSLHELENKNICCVISSFELWLCFICVLVFLTCVFIIPFRNKTFVV